MLRKLSPIQNVQATGIASLSTQELAGFSVHAIHLVLGGTAFTKAMLENIEVRLNKKVLVDYSISATQIQDINTWRGLGGDATHLSIYFGNRDAKDFHGQHVTDLDLSVIKGDNGQAASLDFRFNIVGATAPTLAAYAEVYAPKAALGFSAGDQQFVKALVPTLLTPAAAVVRQAQPIGFGSHAGAGILNEFWFHANLVSLLISKAGITIWDDVNVADAGQLEADNGKTPVAGMYVFSPTMEGFIGALEPTVMPDGKTVYPYQHLLTTSAADSINVFSEIATRLDLL